MTGKEMIKLYKKFRWKVISIRGSHYKMEKGKEIEVIPYHTRELKKGTQEYLLKRLKEVG